MLIESLGHGRSQIEQGRARSDTNHYRSVCILRHAKGIETRRPLIGDGVARDVRTLVEVVRNGRVAATGTHHSLCHPVGDEQRGEYVDILFIRIHDAWCSVCLRSPPTPAPPDCR